MKNINRKSKPKVFKKLLAKCMATALIKDARKRKGKDAIDVNAESFKSTVELIEDDLFEMDFE